MTVSQRSSTAAVWDPLWGSIPMMNTTPSSWLCQWLMPRRALLMRVDCSRLFRATPQREPGERPLRSKANQQPVGRAFSRPPAELSEATSTRSSVRSANHQGNRYAPRAAHPPGRQGTHKASTSVQTPSSAPPARRYASARREYPGQRQHRYRAMCRHPPMAVCVSYCEGDGTPLAQARLSGDPGGLASPPSTTHGAASRSHKAQDCL